MFLVIFMRVIGIVCEYNPMHLGHVYQINEIKKRYPDSIIVIVTCGCFTQRGEVCIINKWDKCRVALEEGVDLVVELPFVYATQSSDIFAKGAVKLLNHLRVDTLVFGSESDDINKFEEIVKTQLNNMEYQDRVKYYLDTGVNYPTAMGKSLKDILGYTVDKPNDILAISYIKEIISNNYKMEYVSIKRTNSYHGNNISDDNIVSASYIRKMISNGEDVSSYVVLDSYKYFYTDYSYDKIFPFLKYQIINQDISKIQTVDEGIDCKLKKVIMDCNSIDEVILKVKSKRYTYNKICRMIAHILTNFTKEEANGIDISYIRLLGFSKEGQRYLNSIKKEINLPIFTHYKKNISYVLDIEYRITCIYSMIVNDNRLVRNEISHKPIIKD